MNTIINRKAEAIYQLNTAKNAGIQRVARLENSVITVFNNRTVVINDFNSITVQFELNGQIYSVRI